MADHTRMKDLQAEVKHLSDFAGESSDRFLRIDARLDQQGDLLTTLIQSVDGLIKRLDKQPEYYGSGPGGGSHSSETHYSSTYTKSVKLDFPRFDGTDALHWIFKAEQYFKYYDIKDPQRVVIAAVHLEGDVLPWFQMLDKSGSVPNWFLFARAIETQFGPSQFDCARGQLFKLTQQSVGGDLIEYNQKFVALANRTDEVPESAILDCYIGGLIPVLKRDVLIQKPSTLLSAMDLARLFAATPSTTVPGGRPRYSTSGSAKTYSTGATSGNSVPLLSGGNSILPPLLPTPNIPPIKKMTSAEMQVRREKGLCYTCDARFSPTHRCPNRQLMMLIGDDEADDVIPEPPPEPDIEATLHHLSLYALRGTHGPATIRFEGTILGSRVQVLLDGGSSDTFIHPRIVEHLQLPRESTTELRVLSGTGQVLRSGEIVRDVPLHVSGHTLILSLFVLPIAGVDLVIGADWLATLGPHVADYNNSTIKIFQDGQFIVLQGSRGATIAQAQLHHLCRLNHVRAVSKCYLLEQVETVVEEVQIDPTYPADLIALLTQFISVFGRPHTLPPTRCNTPKFLME